MAKEIVFGICDLLFELPCSLIILIGGEPTLYPHLIDVIKKVKERKITLAIVTNSLRFADSSFLKEVEDAGLDEAVTSLKGANTQEYFLNTGCGVFDVVAGAIENLEKSSMRHRISVTVSGDIMKNWETMINFVKNSPCENFHFSLEKPVLTETGAVFDERMMPKKIVTWMEEEMYPTLLNTGKKFKIEIMCAHCLFSDGFVEGLEKTGHIFGKCPLIIRNSVIFDPQGEMIPCNHFLNFKMGKFGRDFRTISEFLKQREKHSNFYELAGKGPDPRCGSCKKWKKCGGGCRLYWMYRGSEELLPDPGRKEAANEPIRAFAKTVCTE